MLSLLIIHKVFGRVSFFGLPCSCDIGLSRCSQEDGSVVTWRKIQKIAKLLEERFDPEDFDGCTAPSSRGETSDPEDSDGFTSEFKLPLVSFSQRLFCRCPFSSTQCCFFSGNRHGASSWTTRFSPRTKILKMTDLLERAMFVTITIGSIFNMARTYAKVNNNYFPSYNFLGLSARGLSNYMVCPAHVLSGCLVVQHSFSRPCSCVPWQVSCTHSLIGDRFFVGGDHHVLTALVCVLLSSPVPMILVDPAAVK